MGLPERIGLIRKIEEIRGSTVICFLTSLRQNVPSAIADDSVRVFFDHLLLFPYRSYSAATLIALGADEIVMHPFAELGPIDPTVSNEFNPTDQPNGRR